MVRIKLKNTKYSPLFKNEVLDVVKDMGGQYQTIDASGQVRIIIKTDAEEVPVSQLELSADLKKLQTYMHLVRRSLKALKDMKKDKLTDTELQSVLTRK